MILADAASVATQFGYPQTLTIAQRVIPLVVACVIVATAVELIRRGRLREEFAVLWILASAGLLVLAAMPRLLWRISDALGVFYLTVVVLAGLGFLSLVALHLSTVLSRHADSQRQIAHRLAMLERRLDESADPREDTTTGKPDHRADGPD